MRRGIVLLAFMTAVTLPARGAEAAPGRDCTAQNGVRIAACTQYGIGRGRKQDPHPMPIEFCHRHCAAWYAGCLTSGCWNGDLVRICGLNKK
jgi:hypothetical protein